jgi:hypothetical protein
MPMGKAIKVLLDLELAQRIEKRLPKTDLGSVDEYVNYVVKEVLDQLETEGPAYSKEDEKKVKDRLRALGYMD